MSSVLITGASRGIGRAIAVELAARGHRVIATARRPETLACFPVDRRLRLDVTDQESVDQAVQDAGGSLRHQGEHRAARRRLLRWRGARQGVPEGGRSLRPALRGPARPPG
ncbi:SDR family NAD(P)-dependent oxidoreductase [Streptomyces sp. PA03-1a]|nr:SDR family NAD(P)-dependent oxidoreductase [Streptomyces sp. PA03-1a]MDX2816269.1 SDR family NAD(P)-dependent oxidoreductase [Streptomyces sp. PA03-5A]